MWINLTVPLTYFFHSNYSSSIIPSTITNTFESKHMIIHKAIISMNLFVSDSSQIFF
jgi:hypothetical protein